MKTRISENFEKVLVTFSKQDTTGICTAIDKTRMSQEEREEIFIFFRKNKPTKSLHKEFYVNDIYTGNAFWWHLYGTDSNYQRAMFLKKMILISNVIPWYKYPLIWLKQMV